MEQSDWPAVAKIYQQGMDTNLATFQLECPSHDHWNGFYLAQCRLVILSDDEIAGWAALSPFSSRDAYSGVAEVSLYMEQSFRGKGLGKRLFISLIADSEQNGFWTLQSQIMENNLASIRLHEACGFRIVGFREKIGRDRYGVWRNTVLMERRSSLLPA
jgi:L-amino acid N-acyltransferase YncA